MRFFRRTWAEIDLDRIKNNFDLIKSLAAPAVVMPVVKADAYGHGAPAVSEALLQAGAEWFAVSNLEEALQLRESGIERPVLILGYTPSGCAGILAQNRLTQTVFSLEYAAALSENATAAAVSIDIHIKLDTGMSRLGFDCADKTRADASVPDIARVAGLKNLTATGLYTHFASADLDGDEDGRFTKNQSDMLRYTAEKLKDMGINIPVKHCCNSAGVERHPDKYMDIVRPGLLLYGIHAGGENPVGLLPAMSLKSVISMIKIVKKGDTVSYGRIFTADKDMTVATVPLGYADGYSRSLSGGSGAYMLVSGKPAPVIGRVCMDQLMLDISGISAVAGQTITVFGQDGDSFLPVSELAAWSGTIPYETICLIGKRVPRIYLAGGEIVGQMNYLARPL